MKVGCGKTTGDRKCLNNISVVATVTNMHLKINIDFVVNYPVRLTYYIIVTCGYFNITHYYYYYEL